MKLKHLLYGTLLTGMAASCSNEVSDGPGQLLENETTAYVRISVIGDGETRADADGFENGTPSESMIQSILLTFFDAGRNYVGKTTVSLDEKEDIEVPGAPNTVERVKTFIAKVDLPENINYPKYVVAYVNPTSASNDLTTDKLEDAMRFIRLRSSVSPSDYRTMNNSMYFDATTGNTRFATEVNFNDNFFKTEEEAKIADPSKTVEITVERMEAKVRLNTLPENVVADVTSNSSLDSKDSYTLTFVPEAWFVNGTEKRSFLLKNYRTQRVNFIGKEGHMTNSDFGLNLSMLNTEFAAGGRDNDFAANNINNAGAMRSYWAIDPTYFYEGVGDYYPDISYDVAYPGVNTEGSQNADVPEVTAKYYPLEYRSYNNVLAEYNKTGVKSTSYAKFGSNGQKTHEYVLENTLSYNTLRGTDAKAAMTSVVLLGHYVIKKGETVVFDGSKPNAGAFYVRHEAEANNSTVLNDDEAIDFFIERSGSLFFVQKRYADGSIAEGEYEAIRAAHLDPNSPKNENHVDYGIRHSDFELKYPGLDVTNGKKQSEQWRTLRVKKTNGKYNDNIYVYDYSVNEGRGGYVKLNDLTEEQFPDLLDRMYSTFGVIEKFQSGKAYFNVPLKHIWGNLTSTDNEFKPDNVKLGDYGVVRNHVYDLTINTIKGLGTGIGDLNQPIVPPTQNEQYYISTKLNILKWRVVSQSVDL